MVASCRHAKPDHGHRGTLPELRARVAPTQAGGAPALPPVLQAVDMRHALMQPTRQERRILRNLRHALYVLGFGLIFCILALLLGA